MSYQYDFQTDDCQTPIIPYVPFIAPLPHRYAIFFDQLIIRLYETGHIKLHRTSVIVVLMTDEALPLLWSFGPSDTVSSGIPAYSVTMAFCGVIQIVITKG